MLNNNIKILLVSFVHHIELQNFLNAPRMDYYVSYRVRIDWVYAVLLVLRCRRNLIQAQQARNTAVSWNLFCCGI